MNIKRLWNLWRDDALTIFLALVLIFILVRGCDTLFSGPPDGPFPAESDR